MKLYKLSVYVVAAVGYDKNTLPQGPSLLKLSQAVNINICCDKLEEISDLKMFSECFRGPRKTLWRATFGPRAAIHPPLS